MTASPEKVQELELELAQAREEVARLRSRVAAAEVARDRLQTIFDTIPYPLFAKDQALRYTVCNPAFERYVGKRSEETVGKTVHELASREKADVYHQADLNLLRSGGTQCYEAKVRYFDGSDRDVIFHKAVLPDGHGGVDGMYGFIYDITELRAAEAERGKLEAQLHHAQKLQSIGQLAGGVAHDLNNLLTPILGYGALLINATEADDPRRSHLASVQSAALRARDIVRQLLACGRRQVLEFKAVDVSDFVVEQQEMLQRALRDDIALKVYLPDQPAIVQADVGQLQQVLLNLALNAQDAMPDGGSLQITVSEIALDEGYAAEHPGVTEGPHVALEFSDTGSGMPPDVVQRIFEPFFTTKESGSGTGLGLSTVYGIVKQHGGQIVVYSEPRLGSTFKIFLPRTDQLALPSEKTAEPVDRSPSGNETILVVEDDHAVRTLAQAVLSELGYRVMAPSSVAEAFALVEVDRKNVDLLLSDVVMPEANGKQVYERLQGSLPSLRVVYMSGYNENVISKHGVLDAGVYFVQKPFMATDLGRVVRCAIDNKLNREQGKREP